MSDLLERELGVSSEEYALFERTASAIGLSASDAMRVFMRGFNARGGFPFAVRVSDESRSEAADADALNAMMSPEAIARARQGLEDASEGRTMSLEEAFNKLDESFAL